ncbi:type 2 lanthipeptide synthetase LanM family protein [Streptomyces brasiliscabiei]|uniref:type 2 lanthipeptide synthetase LanM family protein n=1 Tax=Streptomyces brasiliscabiei TaxID=2736302 RepID=UPI001C125C2F|nr:type 2 lanthipeptide synthetase LanM family protein [Streptomyces brasiliscabiei]
MISPAQYYPELDSAEVEETIAPLARFDGEIDDVLGYGCRASGPDTFSLDALTHAAVIEWRDSPELYPFQQVIRTVAVGLAREDPIAGFTSLFADPRASVIHVLTRAEARLRDVYTRPLVASINHAREQQLLEGSTAQERYRNFVEASSRTSFEVVSGLSFPVLRDITRVILHNEVAALRELCGRLTADRSALHTEFGIDTRDTLRSIGLSEGDTHNHGRSVSILSFESGKRLVYKPRDVSCEAAYVTIAHELNARLSTRLASAAVLSRNGYGYVEYIDAEDVSDISARFMRESGELAAVLYLLNARDMHFENILPTRRGPLPVDLETILHPERIHTGPTLEAPGNAYTTIGQSIYGTGILPLVMAGKGADAGHVDLGFLGGQGRGNSPFKSLQFDAPFTDHISVVLRAAAAEQRKTVVNSLSQTETYDLGRHMADGFTKVFRLVMADREGWMALLRKVAKDIRVRYVHNPTALYAQVLRMTSSPSALDGRLPYRALLKRIAIASKTSDPQIVRSEMRQLAERDIPYFVVAAADTDLTDGEGAHVGAVFARSPLDLALAKAECMSEFELGEQLRLIHSAFASRFPDNHLAPTNSHDAPSTQHSCSRGPSQEALATLITDLCDQLIATSLPDRFAHLPRTWIGPLASADANRPWPPGVLGYDLYTGRTGPALALAAAARLLGHREYRALSAQIFSTTAEILATHRYETRSIQQAGYGGYTGMAGLLFALSAAGQLLDEPEWIHAAQDAVPLVLDQVRSQPSSQMPMDVIGGVAGVLSCVTAVGGPHVDVSADELASLLVASLDENGRELSVQSVLTQSGFAHGVSGIIHSLCRAYPHLTADTQQLVEAALVRLISRLHRFYDASKSNWFSNLATPQTFSTGWCHGTAGIALALSAYGSLSGNDAVTQFRDTAISNTVRHGFGRNFTWCHGDLGNHDVLTSLAGLTNGTLSAEIAKIEEKWLHPEVFTRKIRDAKSRYAHTNSLMVGISGIVLHLINRIDLPYRISPVTLSIEGR